MKPKDWWLKDLAQVFVVLHTTPHSSTGEAFFKLIYKLNIVISGEVYLAFHFDHKWLKSNIRIVQIIMLHIQNLRLYPIMLSDICASQITHGYEEVF